jgi:hypothetical protein
MGGRQGNIAWLQPAFFRYEESTLTQSRKKRSNHRVIDYLRRFSSIACTICSSAWFVVVVSTRVLHCGHRRLPEHQLNKWITFEWCKESVALRRFCNNIDAPGALIALALLHAYTTKSVAARKEHLRRVRRGHEAVAHGTRVSLEFLSKTSLEHGTWLQLVAQVLLLLAQHLVLQFML